MGCAISAPCSSARRASGTHTGPGPERRGKFPTSSKDPPPPRFRPSPDSPEGPRGYRRRDVVMAKQWFYRESDESECGPYSGAELRKLVQLGRVRRETLVRTDTSHGWAVAENVNG